MGKTSFILLLAFTLSYCSCNSSSNKDKIKVNQTRTLKNVKTLSDDPGLAELEIYGKIFHLNVLPDGSIWMTSDKSGCYYTKNYDSAWEYVFTKKTNSDIGDFVNVLAFDSSRAILHGYLHNDTRKIIYRTTNRTDWDTIIIDKTNMEFGWVYGGCCNSKGEAWLGTTDNQLLYSSDYGASWEKTRLSDTKNISVYNIYMLSSKIGVASSYDNDIILTNDNFNSCTTVPSPKDQGLTESPSIEKIMLFNDYIILKNFDNTFFTNKNNIRWELMRSHDCLDFGIDREANELYFISSDWRIYHSSPDLKKLKEIHTQLPTKPVDIQIINGTIYILDEFFYLYKIKDETVRRHPLTRAHKIRNFTGINISTEKWVAVSNNAIYESKDHGISWKRIGGDYFAQYSLPNNERNAIAANPEIDGLEYTKIIPIDSNRYFLLAQAEAPKLQQTPSNCIIFDHSEFKEIKTFKGLYVTQIYERSQYYLASAHNDSDSYVYISKDLIEWQQLLKWERCRINNMFINESENVYILNSKGEIKFIEYPTEKPISVKNLLEVSNLSKVYPGDYYSNAFYFINKNEGYSFTSGLSSHSSNGFKTMDGGKSWTVLNPYSLKYNQYYKIDNAIYYSDDDNIYFKNDKLEKKLLSIRDHYEGDVWIDRFSIDRNHNISVRLWNSNNWRRSEFIVFNKAENMWKVIK